MIEALPYFDYAPSGMFQTNNDQEPGGNWYYVGKDVSVGLFGPLPNQTIGSWFTIFRVYHLADDHRFDIWNSDSQPIDNSYVGDKCEGLHKDHTCMFGTSYLTYSLVRNTILHVQMLGDCRCTHTLTCVTRMEELRTRIRKWFASTTIDLPSKSLRVEATEECSRYVFILLNEVF